MFIVFEGLDYSGKTTQLELLAESLQGDVLCCRDPGHTPIGNEIRQILLHTKDKMAFQTELLLYGAARAQMVQDVIKPALERGTTVLCDRYVPSTIAYQGYGRGLDLISLNQVMSFAIDNVVPDYVFYFDIDIETMNQRKSFRQDKSDRMDNQLISFYQKVLAGYHAQYHDTWIVIDGRRSIEEQSKLVTIAYNDFIKPAM